MSRLKRDARGRFVSASDDDNELSWGEIFAQADARRGVEPVSDAEFAEAQAQREYDIWLAGEERNDETMRLAWIIIGVLFAVIVLGGVV